MKLNLNVGREIAIRYFYDSDIYKSLDQETKRRIMIGATLDKEEAKCVFYIPGKRPELGENLMILAINREDGSVREISEDEY